jgi:hypothetical protein
VSHAPAIATGTTFIARAARLEHLDRDTIADLHAPSLGRTRADALDDAHGFVPGDEGEARGQVPGVLLMICAAEPTRLDAQKAVVVTQPRQLEFSRHEVPWRFEHERGRGRS